MIVDLGTLAQAVMQPWSAQWSHNLVQVTVVLTVAIAQGLARSCRKTGSHCCCSCMGWRVVALGIGIDLVHRSSHVGYMGLAAGRILLGCIEVLLGCTENPVGYTDSTGHGSRMLVAGVRMAAAAAVHILRRMLLQPALVIYSVRANLCHSRLAEHMADCTGLGW